MPSGLNRLKTDCVVTGSDRQRALNLVVEQHMPDSAAFELEGADDALGGGHIVVYPVEPEYIAVLIFLDKAPRPPLRSNFEVVVVVRPQPWAYRSGSGGPKTSSRGASNSRVM
jgi:hypothetical protein